MKQHYIAIFYVLAILFFVSNESNARTCTTVADGNWNQTETWSCGAPGPLCGDTIYINHYVQVTATQSYDAPGCLSPTFIVIQADGELNFDSGRKLSFYCGSGITLETGAIISSDAGGASENIKICNTTVWQGSWDASLDGPLVLGSGLPIELLSFDAYYNGENVDIIWQTASETNNDYFTIERSENGIDFYPIAITNGAGTSNSILEYFEVDYAPLKGNSYYRLKQTDFNGEFTYGPTVAVKSYDQLAGELLLYPNPTDAAFHLQFSGFGNEEFVVVVRDLTGKEHYSKVFVTSTDNHIEAFDPSNKLAAGTYIITASSQNELYTQKLVVR